MLLVLNVQTFKSHFLYFASGIHQLAAFTCKRLIRFEWENDCHDIKHESILVFALKGIDQMLFASDCLDGILMVALKQKQKGRFKSQMGVVVIFYIVRFLSIVMECILKEERANVPLFNLIMFWSSVTGLVILSLLILKNEIELLF